MTCLALCPAECKHDAADGPGRPHLTSATRSAGAADFTRRPGGGNRPLVRPPPGARDDRDDRPDRDDQAHQGGQAHGQGQGRRDRHLPEEGPRPGRTKAGPTRQDGSDQEGRESREGAARQARARAGESRDRHERPPTAAQRAGAPGTIRPTLRRAGRPAGPGGNTAGRRPRRGAARWAGLPPPAGRHGANRRWSRTKAGPDQAGAGPGWRRTRVGQQPGAAPGGRETDRSPTKRGRPALRAPVGSIDRREMAGTCALGRER
jgi:hypothetical protein